MPAYAFLGGAFDPVHIAHIRLLTELAKRLSYDRLFIMPYGISPTEKRLQASCEQRKAMIVCALEGQQKLALEDCELGDRQPSYSYRAMEKMRRRYGSDCHLSFVMGEDSYASLGSWRHWQRLARAVNFVVVNRPIDSPDDDGFNGGKNNLTKEAFLARPAGGTLRVNIPFVSISSSAIRAMIRKGEDPSAFLPTAVWQYIRRKKVYHC